VTGGAEVAAGISAFLDLHHEHFALVCASRDWHLPDSVNDGHCPPPGQAHDFNTTWPDVTRSASMIGAALGPSVGGAHLRHLGRPRESGGPTWL
jgi:nicotinamidase/pyrazinamidase